MHMQKLIATLIDGFFVFISSVIEISEPGPIANILNIETVLICTDSNKVTTYSLSVRCCVDCLLMHDH